MALRRAYWFSALGLGALLLLAAPPALAAPTVFTDTGDLSDGIAAFRAALGDPLNGVTPGEQSSGRREINWDAVPDAFVNNDTFPPGFFNTNSKRGAVFSPANGFRVSNNDFQDINPNYGEQFEAFSPTKTFMVVGGNSMEVRFQVAGDTLPASVRGFGVVFSDVDRAGSARIEVFQGAASLGVFETPVRSDAAGLSFVGVVTGGEAITRVRITSGEAPLASGRNDVTNGGADDLVVMDDFLYGEPHVDRDQDGVFDLVDELLTSDTRSTVDLNGNNSGQTRVINRTLSSGQTVQDLVNEIRRTSPTDRDYRRRINKLAYDLWANRVITQAEREGLLAGLKVFRP
jgi:hypothetical protein